MGAGLSALPPGRCPRAAAVGSPRGSGGSPPLLGASRALPQAALTGVSSKPPVTRLWLSRVPIPPASRGLLAVLWLNRTRCHPGVPVQHRPHGHRVLACVVGSAPAASPLQRSGPHTY